jgi:MFS transporter, DHA1 family, multidrug resistance protein
MKSWKINLTVTWIAQFLCIAGFSAAFPFFPFYIRELGVTDPHQVEWWAGLLTSGSSIAMALASPVWGLIADRRGRKMMVQRAAFGGALATGLMAFVGNVHQLFALRILQGLLSGTVPAFMALVSSFVPASETGFALGMMQMAFYTGLSVGPLLGGLIADHFGYRWAFGATGIMALIAGILVLLVVKERFVAPEKTEAGAELKDTVNSMVHSLPIIGALVVLAMFYMARSSIIPILPLFVERLLHGSTILNTSTGTLYGVTALTSAVAAGVIGRLADKKGQRAVLLACCIGAGLTYGGQALSPSYGVLLAMSAATGFFTGGLIPTANAILARLVPRHRQGTVYGLSNSLNAGGRALGPLLGVAVSTAWGQRAAFVAAASLLAILTVWVLAVVRQPAPADSVDAPPSASTSGKPRAISPTCDGVSSRRH